ncbi:hypothetical protein AVEN_231641-1 [Araneus ventricosus]|uniref:Uncharacterized protein n=1 Tax=Araneus ventricosus TaxID=182803 RepID=A0A4Y2K2L8_ARAVE|nr:hypothetical protein AVEN_231641-1 [Araneus ventricosus]
MTLDTGDKLGESLATLARNVADLYKQRRFRIYRLLSVSLRNKLDKFHYKHKFPSYQWHEATGSNLHWQSMQDVLKLKFAGAHFRCRRHHVKHNFPTSCQYLKDADSTFNELASY